MLAGRYALPPWQRGDVWTHEQRVALLDTMMLGLPLPPIVVWEPSHDEQIERLPIAGCPTSSPRGTALVIDGRQRLTTLALAASGALDVRWNGREWTSGRGFTDPPTLLHLGRNTRLAIAAHRNGHDTADLFAGAFDRLYYFKITIVRFADHTLDEMVEAYRRMATCGTPHSEADLEAMVEWRARNQASAAVVDGA
jgi:hypothetical protein